MTASNTDPSSGSAQIRRILPMAAFWVGVVLLTLGSIVSFVPGSEMKWFATAGVVLLGGLFIPKWPYRIAALVLVGYCVAVVIASHENGLKYRLEMHHTPPR